jgi:hypothetical protein
MAGAGYKLFQTGDVLTAAQVNTYLNEQTVMVFANAAARTSALTSVLAEGMMSYLQDTNSVEVYNGSSWVNVGNAGDITEVQAGVGISIASGTGPIPVITNSSTDLITTAGDLLYGTAADTVARLGIGTAGQVLKVNSGATAPEWGTVAAGGGKVLQVVEGSTTTVLQTSSTSFVDSNLTATITPSAATSKVLVIVTQNGCGRFGTASGNKFFIQLLRGATDIGNNADFGLEGNGATGATTGNRGNTYALSVLDSPNTTSATTYKTQIKASSSASAECQVYNSAQTCKSTIILMEIGA